MHACLLMTKKASTDHPGPSLLVDMNSLIRGNLETAISEMLEVSATTCYANGNVKIPYMLMTNTESVLTPL